MVFLIIRQSLLFSKNPQVFLGFVDIYRVRQLSRTKRKGNNMISWAEYGNTDNKNYCENCDDDTVHEQIDITENDKPVLQCKACQAITPKQKGK